MQRKLSYTRSIGSRQELILEHPNALKLHQGCQCPYTQHRGTSSLINVTWNILNAIIGTGILGIPYTITHDGLLVQYY